MAEATSSPATAKDNLGFPDPNLNMGLEVSFDVEAVVLGGEATTGGAIVILLAEVDVGRLVKSFDC